MKRTVLRGAHVLQGPPFRVERRALDVLIEDERIAAIEPANAISNAGEVIELPRRLLVPGLIGNNTPDGPIAQLLAVRLRRLRVLERDDPAPPVGRDLLERWRLTARPAATRPSRVPPARAGSVTS